MSSKKKIYIYGSILILMLLLSIISLFIPKIKITLNGSSNVSIQVGEEYQELGCKAYLTNIFSKKEINCEIHSNVDNSKIGKYDVIYKAVDDNKMKTLKRTVNVLDKTAPLITLNSEITACEAKKIFDINAKVTDNYDGDISSKLEYKVDGDKIILTATDSSKNTTKLEETIHFLDSEKPVITLKGSQTIYLTQNEKYVENGATAMDSCDGDLTDKIAIENNVNVQKVGTYDVKYSVTDNNGNTSTIIRKVFVKAKTTSESTLPTVTNGTIYLTFDDGPGPYTTDILNILDRYNIKATFFVTSQFPGYLDKIKDEYDRGHTVGIHTYSHKWSIYDSVDTYLNDFNKMENIVYEKTGVHPKYFRFPGGTSNEVSIKHSKGIMTTLSKLMPEKGYTYFDWNVDCGDTHKNTSVDYIIKTTKSAVKGNGSYIILMHDIKKNTRDVLATLIEYFKDRGYIFKAIDENTPLKQFSPHN